MARYGAKCPMFAPFAAENAETADAYPKYGAAVTLAELVSSADAPNIIDVKLYGDNRIVENVVEFKDGTIDVAITEMSNENASVLFGAKLDETSNNLSFSVNDVAPYGGYAFYIAKLVDNKKSYQGVYYPKVKAVIQGESYETKGDNITFTTSKLRLNIFPPMHGEWKVLSEGFEQEADAAAWAKTMLGTGEAG